jgi:hypothetical protein
MTEENLEAEFRKVVECRQLKEEWASNPMFLWDSLPEEQQAMLWQLQLYLCCEASERIQNGFGYFCLHPEKEGYGGHWVEEQENPSECKKLKGINSKHPSPMGIFWVCINDGGPIRGGCYQMRFPCEIAIAKKIFTQTIKAMLNPEEDENKANWN